MRKSRFTEAQIIAILKEAEGSVKVADLSREHGISAQTIYNWRAKYGGPEVSEASARARGREQVSETDGR